MKKAVAVEVRFWGHVEKFAVGCWHWKAATDKKGYGRFMVKSAGKWQTMLAHRWAWISVNGSVPDGLHICHRCDNPKCVNPDHLFAATNYENRLDSMRKGRTAKGDRSGARQHPEKYARGSVSPLAKLTEASVAKIKIRLRQGESSPTIAADFNVAARTIRNIKDGDSWRHVA